MKKSKNILGIWDMEFNRMLESTSRLQNFKREMGLNVSRAAAASGYVLSNKVRRILSEMTPDHYRVIKKKYLSNGTRTHKELVISRYSTRVDKLDPEILRYMLFIRERDGMNEFLDLFKKSTAKLRVLAAENTLVDD